MNVTVKVLFKLCKRCKEAGPLLGPVSTAHLFGCQCIYLPTIYQ